MSTRTETCNSSAHIRPRSLIPPGIESLLIHQHDSHPPPNLHSTAPTVTQTLCLHIPVLNPTSQPRPSLFTLLTTARLCPNGIFFSLRAFYLKAPRPQFFLPTTIPHNTRSHQKHGWISFAQNHSLQDTTLYHVVAKVQHQDLGTSSEACACPPDQGQGADQGHPSTCSFCPHITLLPLCFDPSTTH